ncbi:MAG: hypothetical protein GXP47_14955 [Acidobacteria bacterium]|nr:hypothetical protein [Acidobacteriota bacterium]
MAEGPIQTVDQLIEGITRGQVPRQVRLFAAQGLLPVSREDLLRLQIILSADPDEELASIARASVQQEDRELILQWLENDMLQPLELELTARLRNEESVWARIAAHPGTSDETLRLLARNGSALIQDIIMTNQVRILGCLDILEDLRENPQVSKVILRRVKEFEEEFIRKAAEADGKIEGLEAGPSIEEALAELKAIGSHLPTGEDLTIPEHKDLELAQKAAAKGQSATARILTMTTPQKIITALKGSREDRTILIMSRNRLVVRAVLSSPKLSDSEIEKFAASRSVSEEVIRFICQNPRWLRRYPVVLSLAQNPKTPIRKAMHLLPRLNIRHLKNVSKNRNIHPAVRQHALRLIQNRR